jgi:hypothetical protein
LVADKVMAAAEVVLIRPPLFVGKGGGAIGCYHALPVRGGAAVAAVAVVVAVNILQKSDRDIRSMGVDNILVTSPLLSNDRIHARRLPVKNRDAAPHSALPVVLLLLLLLLAWWINHPGIGRQAPVSDLVEAVRDDSHVAVVARKYG